MRRVIYAPNAPPTEAAFLMPAQAIETATTDKRRYVRGMFSDIAPRYDFLNRLLSMRIDRSWRERALARLGWESRSGGTFLDACAGTLDIAATLAGKPAFRGHVIATDFALPMLKHGTGKTGGKPVAPAVADTLQLPVQDASFDGAIVGFGVRNLADLDAGIVELARVLKPGARLVILDFSVPPSAAMRALYLFYFRQVLPLVGRAVSGHPTAYSYLPDSVMAFPPPEQLCRKMEAAGLSACGFEPLTFGIAAITWGTK
jgi:demethylmenaquinone methyltransferase/2-methoxy-6-polyprenyl-1,4-benzoquinol methylase